MACTAFLKTPHVQWPYRSSKPKPLKRVMDPDRVPGVYLRAAIPALPVRAIARSIAFYRDTLGFALVHQDAGFGIVRADAMELHLWEASDRSWQTRTNAAPVVSGAESFIAGTASCRIQSPAR